MNNIFAILYPLLAIAGPGPECTPLILLHESIVYCQDNVNYIPYASMCKNKYVNHVNSQRPIIEKILLGDLNKGIEKGAAQKQEFSSTQDVYASTQKKLTELINQGKQVYAELGAFGDDFVPPIPPWAAGHFMPDRHNPADPARSLEYYCWAEPMGDLDKILQEVDTVVKQLERTRKQVVALKGTTNSREDKLDLTKNAGTENSTSKTFDNTVTKKPGRGSSDITGVEEEIAGQKDIKDLGNSLKISGKKNSPLGTSANGKAPRQLGNSSAGTVAPTTPSKENSIGSILWEEPAENGEVNPTLSKEIKIDSSDRSTSSLPPKFTLEECKRENLSKDIKADCLKLYPFEKK